MEKFTTLTSVGAPMMQSNVDTDIIVPMDRMVTADRNDMHTFAFEPWRFLPDGSENPEFVLNCDPFRGAKILLTAAEVPAKGPSGRLPGLAFDA